MAKKKAETSKKEKQSKKKCKKQESPSNECKKSTVTFNKVKKTKKSLIEIIQKEITQTHQGIIQPFNESFKEMMLSSEFISLEQFQQIQQKYKNVKQTAQNWQRLVGDVGVFCDDKITKSKVKKKKGRRTKGDNFKHIKAKVFEERARGCRIRFLSQKYGINLHTIYSWKREMNALSALSQTPPPAAE